MRHTTNALILEFRCITAFRASAPSLLGSGHGSGSSSSGTRNVHALRTAATVGRAGGALGASSAGPPLPSDPRVAAHGGPRRSDPTQQQAEGRGERGGATRAGPSGRPARGAGGGGSGELGEGRGAGTSAARQQPREQRQRRQQQRQQQQDLQRRQGKPESLDAWASSSQARPTGQTTTAAAKPPWVPASIAAHAGGQRRTDGGADARADTSLVSPASPDPLLGLLLRVVRPLDEAGFAYCAVRRTAAWLHGVALPLRCCQSDGATNTNTNTTGSSAAISSSSGGSAAGVGGDLAGGPGSAATATDTAASGPTETALEGHGEGAGGGVGCGAGGGPGGPVSPAAAAVAAGAGLGSEAVEALPELELEVQWDQMKTIHELLGRQGPAALWRTGPLRDLPRGTARFTLTATLGAGGGPGNQQAAAAAATSRPRPYNASTCDQLDAAQRTHQSAAGPTGAASAAAAGGEGCSGGGGSSSSSSGLGFAGTLPSVPVAMVSVCCTYNTTLRARPDRLLVRPRPPPLSRSGGGGAIGPGVVAGSGPGGETQPQPTLAVLTAPGGSSGSTAASGETTQVWSQSLYSVGVEAERTGDGQLAAAVRAVLRSLQRELSAANTDAWGRDTAYDAWVARFGAPPDAAARLLRDPGRCLGPLLPYMTLPDSPPLRGLRVANLCGSHGTKATALAALGARVTVVDASVGNAAYARALAEAAGLADAVSYVVGDVAELRPCGGLPQAGPAAAAPPPFGGGGGGAAPTPAPPCLPAGQFDLVLMEMGVLHYFVDLGALMRDVVAPLLRPGGRLLLREFHPVSTKLITTKGKKHKVSGDYFATQPLTAVDVAYSKYNEEMASTAAATAAISLVSEPDPATDATQREAAGAAGAGGGGSGGVDGRPTAYLRRWGMGEVVTAVCGSGLLAVRLLDEEPGPRLDDAGLPKVFTLLAERAR